MTLIRKLNPTYFFWFCLLLALALRVKNETNFPQLDSDYATETEAAKNFIAGHGFSTSTVNPENLSEITYAPLTTWPVGYAMLLVPFYYVCGSFITSAVLVQCISTILLLFGIIKLLRTFNISQLTISLCLLFLAFSPTPFSYLGTTDQLTGAFFLWIIAYSIDIYNSDKTEWKKIIVISMLLVLSCMLRFACIPNIVIIPTFLAACAIWQKKYKLLIPASIIIFFSLVGTVIFFSIFKIDSGRTGFLQNLIHFNLYYKHMLWFDSYPIKALFFPRPIEFRLPHNLMLIRIFRIGLHLASLLFIIYLISYFIKKVKLSNSIKHSENKNIFPFLILFASATLTICGFISMQSLTTGPENNSFGPSWMPKMWTFVYCTRYFVILILLFQVLFFMMLNEALESINKNKISNSIAKSLYVLALGSSVLQWAYTTTQYHFGNGAASYWHNGKSEIATFHILNQACEENPKTKIIYSCFNRVSYDGGSMSLYSKAYVCRDYQKMMGSDFKHNDPTILYVLMPKENLNEKELAFLSTYKPETVQTFETGTLYRTNLK